MPTNELILCGWDEVFILDLSQREKGRPKKIWTWRAKERGDLPQRMKEGMFSTTDECKPVHDGSKILITSSSWGVALADRTTGKTLFYGVSENAHSADMLPSNRIAVAASHHQSPGPPQSADRVTIFDATVAEKDLYHTDLSGGHGVVWDEDRQILWTMGSHVINAYRVKDWGSGKPSLSLIAQLDLPEGGGHDLYPVPGSRMLTATTVAHCWLLDRDRRSFVLHPQLGDIGDVKSISVNPATGQIAYVQGEGKNWWAERVHFLTPDSELCLPGEHLYKARWNVQAPLR